MKRLEGNIAIVTGGASGIGAATAVMFAYHGAKVLVADKNGEGARKVVDSIRKSGGVATAHLTDVSDEQAVEKMVQAAVKEFGGLDTLVSNAAELSPDIIMQDKGVTDTSDEIIEKTFKVNLHGVLCGMRYAIPEMVKRGGGSLITILSAEIYGPEGHLRTAYGSSKSGAQFLANQAAVEFGPSLIRSNCIAPSLIETPPVQQLLPPEIRDVILAEQLIPGMIQPADVAKLASFLASTDSRFITGQTIHIDGGYGSHSPARTGMNRVITEMVAAAQPPKA